MRANKTRKLWVFIIIVFFMSGGCVRAQKPFACIEGHNAGKEEELSGKKIGLAENEQGSCLEENVPTASEFILGPNDRLEISVYAKADLTKTVQITPSGKIMYPLLGDVYASGLSIFQLRDVIHDGLSKYMIDPQVTITIVSMGSQKIIVLGQVNTPGFFQAENSMSVLDLISKAGGFTANAKQNNILLIRGGMKKPKLIKLNIERALKKGDLSQNSTLQRGDIVYVPSSIISDVNRFFNNLSTIIAPIVGLETGYFVGQQIDGSRGAASNTP